MKLKENSFLQYIVYAIIAFVLIAWACSLVSCSTSKKNEKAFSLVLSNEELYQRMVKKVSETDPCIPVQGIKGKDSVRIDTVFNNDIVFGPDSAYTSNDTITIIRKVPVKVPVYITKTISRVDTVPDLRRINLMGQDLAKEKGKSEQLEADKKQERKRANNYLWLLIGGFALYVATRFIKVKPEWV